jgi:hypothetical protein
MSSNPELSGTIGGRYHLAGTEGLELTEKGRISVEGISMNENHERRRYPHQLW